MEIIREYLALCWFQNEPLELPRSVTLLKNSLLVYFIVGYLLQANMIDDPFEAFYEVSFQIIFMLIFIGVIMVLNKTLYVYIQVTTAFIFCANVISIFIVPVMVWLTISEDLYSYYMLFLLLGWYYLIVTYIVKYTLIINIPASLVLSILYFIFTYWGAFAIAQVL
ncbi:MAG: hypothetical protein IPN42_06905 [Methylococcaceae bacterium]|nr:hypothetical protein [Methylococcaceae bacterium]